MAAAEDEFVGRAAQIALAEVEEQLIRARRDYEDICATRTSTVARLH